MVNYRRHFTPGGSYFFTVALHNRHASHLIDSIDLLRTAFRKTQTQKPFRIDAIVVLPEHLHCIWTLPDQDSDYPARWQLIKSVFSHELEKSGVPVIRRNDGSYLIWQRRYWEHTIRNDSDMQRHIDYIHFNPVKHGLVKQAEDWPYSSLHRYIRMGWLPENWAGVQLDDLDCGE
ncbi:transposase [Methylomonas paludis]|uniref:Transposase n=1 Tax=Methylomonas paludis TaxID=1173101 RepID=A0A975RB95_9GAMM|nr:transposase [Methylomonas paludis]QWF72051.1 transposase [Methylomonas paludis]